MEELSLTEWTEFYEAAFVSAIQKGTSFGEQYSAFTDILRLRRWGVEWS